MLNMNKIVIKPFNVVDHTDLPEMSVDQIPTDGDPLEIKGELYYVCEKNYKQALMQRFQSGNAASLLHIHFPNYPSLTLISLIDFYFKISNLQLSLLKLKDYVTAS